LSAAADRRTLVADAFDAFNAGNVSRVVGLMDPEVEVHVAPPLVNAGTWRGVEGFLAMAAAWGEPWDEIHYELRGQQELGRDTLLLDVRQTARGAGSGVPVERDVVYLLGFAGDRLVRFHVYPDRATALAGA
jgi:ketosteroid isomerase-like protein